MQTMKKVQEETTNLVLARVIEFQKHGQLTLPKDFSPENALKAAWFALLETKDRNKKSVLDTCTKGSITNALFEMILQGLNPMKKQCAFIAYGDQLQMQREYHGTIALAKRFGGVKNVFGHVIYKEDVFKYSLNKETGVKEITEHTQVIENIDNEKIRGAYAVLILEDGSQYIEIMNMAQIKKSWEMGAMKGKSPAHINFPDQMSIKTVISRACKLFISSSDDGSIVDLNKKEERVVEVPKNANKETIAIEATVITEDEEGKGKKETEKPAEKPIKKDVKKDDKKENIVGKTKDNTSKDGQVEANF